MAEIDNRIRAKTARTRSVTILSGIVLAWALAYGVRFVPLREYTPSVVDDDSPVVRMTANFGKAPALANRTELAPAVTPTDTPTSQESMGVASVEYRVPQFRARDPEEWQGLLVDISQPSGCERVDGCNLGLACIRGKCLPCDRSADCAAGEACVLDHCIPSTNVSCSSRADCGSGELCFLNGYGGTTVRMNEKMISYCALPSGSNPTWDPDGPEIAIVDPAEPEATGPVGPFEGLARTVREHAKGLDTP